MAATPGVVYARLLCMHVGYTQCVVFVLADTILSPENYNRLGCKAAQHCRRNSIIATEVFATTVLRLDCMQSFV